MSITLTEIITVEEYLSVFPQDSSVEETAIQSAINRATITLDGICGGMIAKVWTVTDPTSEYYRTDTEKGYVKQATILQAQYNVSKNLDFSVGSENYSSGSNNYNETRSRADLVVDETIYQLLAQARVYNPNITTDTTIAKTGNLQGFYDPSYDPQNEYITYAVGDLRYVPKHYVEGADKFLKYDTNGNINWTTISASPTGTSSAIANFITIDNVEYQLGGGGSAEWGRIIGSLSDQTDLAEKFTEYYTITEMDEFLAEKQHKVYYGEIAPEDPQDNDIWVFDQPNGGGGITQVQSDWAQEDTSAVDYIKNKPTIATTISATSTNTQIAGAKAVWDLIQSLDGNNDLF